MSNPTVITDSEQYIDNKSFDATFGIQQVELVGYDSVNNVLRPLAVTTTGLVKVSV